jgi:hypothetical protein
VFCALPRCQFSYNLNYIHVLPDRPDGTAGALCLVRSSRSSKASQTGNKDTAIIWTLKIRHLHIQFVRAAG